MKKTILLEYVNDTYILDGKTISTQSLFTELRERGYRGSIRAFNKLLTALDSIPSKRLEIPLDK